MRRQFNLDCLQIHYKYGSFYCIRFTFVLSNANGPYILLSFLYLLSRSLFSFLPRLILWSFHSYHHPSITISIFPFLRRSISLPWHNLYLPSVAIWTVAILSKTLHLTITYKEMHSIFVSAYWLLHTVYFSSSVDLSVSFILYF